LAHKGRAPLDQIRLSLGHVSIITTVRQTGQKESHRHRMWAGRQLIQNKIPTDRHSV
jgi:hypothetical protein